MSEYELPPYGNSLPEKCPLDYSFDISPPAPFLEQLGTNLVSWQSATIDNVGTYTVYFVAHSVFEEAFEVTFDLTIRGLCTGQNLGIQVTPSDPIAAEYVTTEPAKEIGGYSPSIDFNCEYEWPSYSVQE